MNRNRQEKGITLIALVITIIVMLILAGVAINMTIGDNGIFKKSDEGAKIYKNAANNEATSLNSMDKEMADLMEQLENSEDPTGIVDIVRAVWVGSVKTEVEPYWVLTADGKIRVWRVLEYGNVFDKLEMGPEVRMQDLPNGNIAHIATNGYGAVVLDEAGKVYTFGISNKGRLGNGSTENCGVPICISDTGDIQGKVIKEISIDAYGKVIAIDVEGKIYGWGGGNSTPVCVSNEVTGLKDAVITEILYRYADNFIVKDNAGKIHCLDTYNNNIIDLDTLINEENIEILQEKDIIDLKWKTFLDRDGMVYTMSGDTVVCMNDNVPVLHGKKIVEIKSIGGVVLLKDQGGCLYALEYDDVVCLNDDSNSEIYNKKVNKIITGYIRGGEFGACIVGNDIYILSESYPA